MAPTPPGLRRSLPPERRRPIRGPITASKTAGRSRRVAVAEYLHAARLKDSITPLSPIVTMPSATEASTDRERASPSRNLAQGLVRGLATSETARRRTPPSRAGCPAQACEDEVDRPVRVGAGTSLHRVRGRRNENDRGVFGLARIRMRLGGLEAVHARHLNVHEDHGESLVITGCSAASPDGASMTAWPSGRQHGLERQPLGRVVIDDKNRRLGGSVGRMPRFAPTQAIAGGGRRGRQHARSAEQGRGVDRLGDVVRGARRDAPLHAPRRRLCP